MATAGSIVVDLLARTGSFETDMQRASRRVKSTTSDFEKAAAAAQKYALAAGAVAVAFATSTAAIVMSAAKAMDATSKMAQQIGVTTEALTGLRFAAQQFASISDQQFDMSMRRMTRRIEEAAAGSGAAKAALEEMGLSAQALSRLTPDRQMLALADAMKRTESQANRLRYTMAIFDTEGMALVPALQQGAAALEENIKLAERYGVVLSTEAAQAAEQFNTNLSHLTSMLDGLKMQLASEVLPTINQFISNALQAATEVDGLHSEVKGLANDSAFKEWFDASLIGLARVADVAVFVAKAVGTVGLAFQAAAADVQAGLAWIAKPNAADKLLMPAEDYNRLVAEYEAAMSRQETTVGRFNQTLDNLLTYQGNRFEQAAITAVNTVRVTSDQVKLVDLTTQGATKSTDANTAATKKNAAALTEAQRAAQAFRREQDRGLIAQLQSVSAIHQQAQGLEDQVALFGQSKTALEDLTIARLEEQAAVLRGFDGSQEQVDAIEREIEARQRLRSAMGTLEAKEAADKANKEALAEWQRTTEQMGQSLTDALLRGFESGKGFAENFRDTLKNMFRTLVLQPIIQPIMNSVAGTIQGALGMGPGQSGGGLMGLAQNASSAHSALTGGPSSMFGNAAQWLGKQVGSEALSAFGMGMSGAGGIAAIGTGVGASLGTTIGTSAAAMTSTTFSAALGGTAGVASGSGVVGSVVGGGAAGLGSAIGAALPWVGGALALGSAFGLFDSGPPKTRHGQRTTIDYAGGAYGISAIDDRQAAGSEQAALAAAQSAVAAANDLFARIGVNAGIESFYAIMESSVLGDRNGVASGGSLRIGDQLRNFGVPQASDMTLGGFGGWSSAEMLPRLQTDIQLSILEAFQSLGSQLPSVLSGMLEGVDLRNISAETAQDLATRFAAVADGATQFLAAIEAMPFEQLRGLSFDAAAGLVQLAGGVEGLLSAQQTYYQAFYSEAERHGIAVNNLTSALSAAGVVMPELTGSTDQMLASYRAIVEAQDLNTEAGRQVYVALMQASGAFAEVAQYAGQAAAEVVAVGRSQADIDRERLGLESQLLGLMGNTNELRRRELETLDASNRALQQQIWAYQDLSTAYSAMVEAGQREIAKLQESFGATDSAMSGYRSAVQKLESEFGNLIATIGRGVADLRGQVTEAARVQYHQARAVISTTLLTGQLPQTADLTEAIRVAQQGVMGQRFASREDQQRAYLTLANEMEAIKGIAEPELDTAKATLSQLEDQYRLLRGMSLVGEDSLTALEQQLRTAIATEEAARRQISAIEEQINWAKEQHDRLLEIRDGVLAFPEALAGFASSLAAAIAAANKAAAPVGGGGGGGYTPVPGTSVGSSNWTTDYFLANPDVLAEYDVKHGMSPEQYAQYHWDNYGKYEGRKFARGGFALPGWAMVGEEGPELVNFSNPGRVYTAGQTNDILRNLSGGFGSSNTQALERRIDDLVEQNKKMAAYLYQIAKDSKRTARQTEPLERQSDDVVVVM